MKNNNHEIFQIVVFFMFICIAAFILVGFIIINNNDSNDIDYDSISLAQYQLEKQDQLKNKYIHDKDFRYSIISDGYLKIDKKYTINNMVYNPVLKIFTPHTFTYYKKLKLIKITSMDQN